MWFRGTLVSSGRSLPEAVHARRRDQFLCGGLLLLLAGWVAAHPLPSAPNLPSASRLHRSRNLAVTQEMAAARQPAVWLDRQSGVYYFAGQPEYGRTPAGTYLDQKAARAHGYRSSARW
jgi:hypothetical protein